MASTTIPITSLTFGTPSTLPAYTEVSDIEDGATLDISQGASDILLNLKFSCSGSSTAAVSIKAGDNPPAWMSGLGDIVIAPSGSAANAEYLFSMGETARIAQSTGKAEITFDDEVVTAAYARAIKLPK